MTNEQIWQAALGEMELSLSKANFTTWFRKTFILEYTNDHVVIGVPNVFTKAWLENKYNTHIAHALQRVTDCPALHVSYKVVLRSEDDGKVKFPKHVTTSSAQPAQPRTQNSSFSRNLNPKYLFENFVVGKQNDLAHAAAKAVSEKPGKVYNPLFIYGGVGLGKTHLVHAIGNEILKEDARKILYISMETFTNEFIREIKQGGLEHFKDKYRTMDVLLIDDIQFITGKERTQEEFFHTFNHLHALDKQIVLTSDRLPKAIPGLASRLLSRFEWGMIVDVGTPDLETRIAILKSKCEDKNVNLVDEVVQFIAANIQNNIRELEGALNRVIAMQQFHHIEPTVENTKQILANIIQPPRRGGITTEQIMRVVIDFFALKKEDLVGVSRKKQLVGPRQIAMYLMREELRHSFPNIGAEFGGRDHTTAMHACEKIQQQLERDEKVRQDVAIIRERLYN